MRRLRLGSGAPGVLIAGLAAIALAAFGVVRGTWATGGSDSSCYALMAQAMANGDLQPASVLAIEAPWPDAPRTLAPGGFIPSPVRKEAASPICAPGMSLLMAPLALVFGADAIFWLVPIAGAVLVMSAFLLARALAGSVAGATAAVLTATSPIVLFQVVQPMNDILTAALWMAAFAILISADKVDKPSTFASDATADKTGLSPPVLVLAGVVTGIAILVRPNLAPLALVVAALPFILKHEQPSRAGVVVAAAALSGVVVMLWLNRALYGGIFASGYGDASQLFSAAHLTGNLTNFGRAAFQTQNVLPLLALLAPVVFTAGRRRISLALLAGAFVVIAIYLLYQPYPEWWYLRFLIPALVMLLVLASAVAVALATRARMGG